MSDLEQQTPAPAGDPEQAAHLALLQQQAASDPATLAATAEAEAIEAARVPLSTEIAGLLNMAVGILGPMLPSVAAIYTPEVTQAVGVSVGAVCDKHGWLQGGVMGEYGEEVACLLVVGPLAWSTYEAAKVDIGRLKAKAADKPGAVEAQALQPASMDAPVGEYQVPGQKTVTFGAGVPSENG